MYHPGVTVGSTATLFGRSGNATLVPNFKEAAACYRRAETLGGVLAFAHLVPLIVIYETV